jgi:hypothetical protein
VRSVSYQENRLFFPKRQRETCRKKNSRRVGESKKVLSTSLSLCFFKRLLFLTLQLLFAFFHISFLLLCLSTSPLPQASSSASSSVASCPTPSFLGSVRVALSTSNVVSRICKVCSFKRNWEHCHRVQTCSAAGRPLFLKYYIICPLNHYQFPRSGYDALPFRSK